LPAGLLCSGRTAAAAAATAAAHCVQRTVYESAMRRFSVGYSGTRKVNV